MIRQDPLNFQDHYCEPIRLAMKEKSCLRLKSRSESTVIPTARSTTLKFPDLLNDELMK